MKDRAWEEMLAEFRELGGTAHNICLREGTLGRGLFPMDPARPIAVRIPENLLIDITDAEFDNGAFRVASHSKAGAREKAFVENYQNRFAWGGEGRAEMERIFEQAQALPAELRRALKFEYHCGDWFDDLTDKLLQTRFIDSRCISYKNRFVIMPIVELANHSPGGGGYATKDGVALQGAFPGEIFAKYADLDPHGMFANWGFAGEQPQAFSSMLKGKIGQSTIQIDRELGGLPTGSHFWIPQISKIEPGVKLQFLMIGNRQYPRLCKGIFYKLMREAGFSDIEEAFDKVQHANLSRLTNLLSAIENIESPMAQMLRRMVRLQLQAMSYCFGVRAI